MISHCQLHKRLLSSPVPRDDSFYASLLDNAAHLNHLRQILAHIIVNGLHQRPFLATKFVHRCSRFGLLKYARHVFDQIPHPDIFLWNAIMKLYSQHGHFQEALRMYNVMMANGQVRVDGFTLPVVLRACGCAAAVETGRAIHAQIFRHGFEADVFAQNGLVAMYAKCKELGRASKVFGGLREKNVVSWTSMISGCVQCSLPLEALQLFRLMRSSSDVRPDFVSLVSVLKAYTDIEDLEHGKSVHGCAIKIGWEFESDVRIALTAMYAKCGQVLVAKSLFEQILSLDVILWNTMISGYAKNGYSAEAVELFHKMVTQGMQPDSITLRAVIVVCSKLGSSEAARWMEDYAFKSGFKDDVLVNTALIDMYAKCSSMESAHRIFRRVSSKDVIVWSAIIMGYGLNGCAQEAILLFQQMEQARVRPNNVTFLGLLLACSHTGLVKEGWNYFRLMREYRIDPGHQHYACMVDLLSRAGHLHDAFELIMNMPMEPTISIWGSLLSACKVYGNVELGSYAAQHIFSLDSSNAGHYVQLSNLYASASMWDAVAEVRFLMKDRGVVKPIGSSFN